MSGCSNCNTCETSLARGCSNSSVFNWLEGISTLNKKEDSSVEVRLKQDRKGFFINPEGIPLTKGDIVAVEGSPGHDVGVVSLTGELVMLQMKRKKVDFEKASILRERIKSLNIIQSSQRINEANLVEADVIATYKESGKTCIQVFFIGLNKIGVTKLIFLNMIQIKTLQK